MLQTSRDNVARAVVAGLVAFDFCFDAFGCKQLNIRMDMCVYFVVREAGSIWC